MTDNITALPPSADREARLKAHSIRQLAPLLPAIFAEIAPMLDAVKALAAAESRVACGQGEADDDDHCVVAVRPAEVREAVAMFARSQAQGQDGDAVYRDILAGGPAFDEGVLRYLEFMEARTA